MIGMSQFQLGQMVPNFALEVRDKQSVDPIITVNHDSSEIKYAGKTYTKSNLFTEWYNYLSDCNELVPDTIRQTGMVKCELIPVKMNGKIVSYNTVPIDTIWNKCDCNDYKINNGYLLLGGDNSWITSTSIGSITSGYSLSQPEPAKNTFTIRRNKICMIKKKKADFDDFFSRWCVEKKLIEFN